AKPRRVHAVGCNDAQEWDRDEDMRRSERIAKAVVETVIQGATMVYRIDQSQGVHDFDLHLPNGTIVAAEVTESVDEGEKRINAAIFDLKKGGSAIKTRLCRNDWLIDVDPDRTADIRLIRAKIDASLAELEADGVSEFGFMDGWRHPVAKRIHR